MKSAFLDSSVLFTAIKSPTGGSSKLFTYKDIQLFTSKVVLVEVEKNVRQKLQGYHLDRFFMLVDQMITINQIPSQKLIIASKKVTVEKDAVILAEAKQVQSDYLVTLDKKHFLTKKVANFLKPKKVITPKGLIELL